MFLSKWLKFRETPEVKEFKSNIIYGDQLREKWDITSRELSYIVLKKDLSVLDLPNKITSHSIFDPNYYKVDQNELIDTLLCLLYSTMGIHIGIVTITAAKKAPKTEGITRRKVSSPNKVPINNMNIHPAMSPCIMVSPS